MSSWMSGAKMEQVHDLRDPGAGYLAEPCQTRVVGHCAGLDQVVQMNRERHEFGDVRYATAGGCGIAAVHGCEMDLAFDRDRSHGISVVVNSSTRRSKPSGWKWIASLPVPPS